MTATSAAQPDRLARSAAAYGTAEVPTATPGQTIAAVREAIQGRDFDAVQDVVVLDRGRAVGLLDLETLLEAPPGRRIHDLMRPEPPTVTPETDREMVAHLMAASGSHSVIVAEPDGAFLGLIPPPRMLEVLVAEHDTDMARIGGYVAGARQAIDAAREPVDRRLLHRLPWVLLGVVGAMASALLVGAFDVQLEANVIVAFFVPAIVYMADAVGTQTETVLIRALAAGVSATEILWRELISGFIMGAVVGASFFAFVVVGWGEADVAVAVGLAMLASCSIATLIAIALPVTFQHFNRDPAFGSGPLATVIQDLLSIAVYLGIVVAII